MKLREIASRLKLPLRGDGDLEIVAPAPIEAAAPGTIVFVANARYAAALREGRAACAIVAPALADEAKCATLISDNPYRDFARVLELFFPPYRPAPGIDPTARIAPGVKIGPDSHIGAYAVLGEGVTVGERATIHPHVTIYPRVRIGADFLCHSQVSIREGVTIGDRVTILSGAVIGADGFGFVESDGALVKIPQVGTVIIEDDVEIGANSTVDRAMMGATVLHRGVKLDNLVHIGHNCEVGEYTRFSAQVGISGSVKIGKWCLFGGQAGCADHIGIGDRAMAAAQSGIAGGLKENQIVGGSPAIDIRLWRRMAAAQARLPEMLKRIRALEQRTREREP